MLEQGATQAGQADALRTAQREIDGVREIMTENIERVLERGEHMAVLVDKTGRLGDNARDFRVRSRTLKRRMWWKNVKLMVLLCLVVVFLIYLFVGFGCGLPGEFLPPCRRGEREVRDANERQLGGGVCATELNSPSTSQSTSERATRISPPPQRPTNTLMTHNQPKTPQSPVKQAPHPSIHPFIRPQPGEQHHTSIHSSSTSPNFSISSPFPQRSLKDPSSTLHKTHHMNPPPRSPIKKKLIPESPPVLEHFEGIHPSIHSRNPDLSKPQTLLAPMNPRAS